jgi:hypothetical protein
MQAQRDAERVTYTREAQGVCVPVCTCPGVRLSLSLCLSLSVSVSLSVRSFILPRDHQGPHRAEQLDSSGTAEVLGPPTPTPHTHASLSERESVCERAHTRRHTHTLVRPCY